MPRPPKKPRARLAPRTPAEVARRCIILLALVRSGHKDRRAKIVPWLKREGLWPHVSPIESRFLLLKRPPYSARAYATWRVEALIPLLWSLFRFPTLPPPSRFLKPLRTRLPELLEPTRDFITSARLRSPAAIRREQDKVVRTAWAIRDSELNDKPRARKIPRSIDPEVIMERHHSLNWLVNDAGEAWDDVSTDN